MLAGNRPFQAETPSDLQAAILRDNEPALSANIKFQKEFSVLIGKCLEKDWLKRFQTVSDFMADAKIIRQKLNAEKPRENWQPRDWILKAVLPFVLIVGAFFGVSNFAGKLSLRSPNQANMQTAQIIKKIESLAVAPFENAANDNQINFLSEGLAEDLSRNLGSLNQFRVVSYASSRKIKPNDSLKIIKDKLHVRSLLRGKIEKENENLFVKIELLDLEDGTIL